MSVILSLAKQLASALFGPTYFELEQELHRVITNFKKILTGYSHLQY